MRAAKERQRGKGCKKKQSRPPRAQLLTKKRGGPWSNFKSERHVSSAANQQCHNTVVELQSRSICLLAVLRMPLTAPQRITLKPPVVLHNVYDEQSTRRWREDEGKEGGCRVGGRNEVLMKQQRTIEDFQRNFWTRIIQDLQRNLAQNHGWLGV